jgi:hypothetical protein
MRSKLLKPDLEIMVKTGFIIVNEDGSSNVHGIFYSQPPFPKIPPCNIVFGIFLQNATFQSVIDDLDSRNNRLKDRPNSCPAFMACSITKN